MMDILPTPKLGETQPKVVAQAIYGTITGGVLAAAVIELATNAGVHDTWFKPNTVVLLTAICTGVCGFVTGWLKKHGMSDG